MKLNISSLKVLTLTSLTFTLLGGQALAAPETMFTNATTINSGYSRPNAKSYAETYAARPDNSAYANYGSGGDGGDCTNFVSQVLHGGGLAFHGTDGNNDFNTDWYYYGADVPAYAGDTGSRTSTWTGAHQFRQHWANVNGTGGQKAYQAKKYTVSDATEYYNTMYFDLYEGDIIQHVNSAGHTIHSQVVHAYSGGELYVVQHSLNDSAYTWGSNIKLSSYLSYGGVGGHVVTTKIKS